MSQLQEAKERYDGIPIPKELTECVQTAIRRSAEERERSRKVIRMTRRNKFAVRSAKVAAAAAAAFIFLLNTNTAFAEELADVPIIGPVARVLTFRSYEKTNDDLSISVDIPSMEMISEDTNGLADSVNREILAMCEQYAQEAVTRAEEYKKAFMETGGTEEEWAAHNIQIKVWYEIKSQSEDYLSFVVRGAENWTSAYNESRYYNIDLKTEKRVTLKDLLGEEYKVVANESIQRQIQERTAEGKTFWTEEENGFSGISDEPKFYINQNNNPVIVFEKYEIAPGSEGEIEFEITKN